MRIHYECIACAVNQAQKIAEMSTEDFEKRRRAMLFVARKLGELFSEDSIPAVSGGILFLELYRFLGDDDPFNGYKETSTRLARKVARDIGVPKDFKAALKLAIAGNVIDFAVGYDPSKMEEDIFGVTGEELRVDHSDELLRALENAGVLLYLTDNCGEVYFDRLLLEFIRRRFPGLRIYVAAKDGPIINDATVADLLEAGFNEFAEVISTGSRLPGTPLEHSSGEFRRIFNAADVIIAKGQANFETLSDLGDSRVFFLLKAKCPPIARELGVERGSLLCVRGGKIDD
ncbi:DUF89 domain-containing protein [Thermococcus sp. 18S1]|uniref:damage-control phosphatase n=1 Tax=Thermococcus sp. 18S1 TaxID=1638210 RepID=UPI00143A21D8|nr:damage-control phosphatase [Thermococcus sp. 18S1]NJE30595.1 DUF89 domain-containing protein [Thermococcus sp. 18S1]